MGKRILHFILLVAIMFQGMLTVQNDKVTTCTDFEVGKSYQSQQATNWLPAAPTFPAKTKEKPLSGGK